MRLSFKQHLLLMVGIITLSSLLGCIFLIHNTRSMGKGLRTETENRVTSLVALNALKIDSVMRTMERNALDLAGAGEAFFHIVQKRDVEITPLVQDYLVTNFTRFPEAIGGGIWYEPHLFSPSRKHAGFYAYRKGEQVRFTWDLSTPEYDYLNQSWYVLGIPPDWDRTRLREKRVYWTDPYFDEAGTQALMITVDALMTDGGKQIIGMATVDFSLESLKRMVSQMAVTPGSLPFAIHVPSGLLTAFPADPVLVMKGIGSVPWGEYLKDIQDMTPGVVSVRAVTIDDHDFSLFYTKTPQGTAMGILSPHEELYAEIQALNRANLITAAVIIGVQILLYVLIAFFLVRRICTPINRLIDVAQEIAEGDIMKASDSLVPVKQRVGTGRDETGRLTASFEAMTGSLHALFRQVQTSGEQVKASVDHISVSSRQLESTMTEQARATAEANKASKEISETARALAGAMNTVASTALDTERLAEEGHRAVEEMETSVARVLTGNEAISARLEEIRESAKNIGSIVSAMTRVADQTNLLSLNAAIEAEKAGQFGAGFSVVASEIRRLADQTSVSVLDIEDMVKQMESSVEAGASEMETFTGDVRLGATVISKVGRMLDGIMEKVRTLTPRLGEVNRGMEGQSSNAEHISETMEHLHQAAQKTLKALGAFKETAQYLDEAVSGLEQEVSRFRVEKHL